MWKTLMSAVVIILIIRVLVKPINRETPQLSTDQQNTLYRAVVLGDTTIRTYRDKSDSITKSLRGWEQRKKSAKDR